MTREEMVDKAAQALYLSDIGYWVSGHDVDPGGTPWGTSREKSQRASYVDRVRVVLDAVEDEIRAEVEAQIYREFRDERRSDPSTYNVWTRMSRLLDPEDRAFRLWCRECQNDQHHQCKDPRVCPCAKKGHTRDA